MPIDKQATVTWYNTAAPLYCFFRSLTKKVDDEVMPFAIDCLDLHSTDTVLDAGTGPGTYAIEIAQMFSGKTVGVDLSSRFISLASRRAAKEGLSNVDFLLGDLESLPFATCEFSKIVCAGALQAVTDRVRAAKELHRVLRQDGRAIVVEPHKHNSLNDRLFLILMYLTGLSHKKLHAVGIDQLTDYFFVEESLHRLLRNAGFSRVEIVLRSGTMCAVCDK